MAFEEMLENWDRFNLTIEEEETEIDVDRQAAAITSRSLGFSLFGKLLAPRVIARDVMRRNFKAAWNIPSGLTVEKVGKNIFLFTLKSKEEQTRVLRQGPSLFDRFLLVLSKHIPMVKPSAMEFKYVMFWVHFCDLPMDVYNISTAERLGNTIGKFEAFDSGNRGLGWKESLQVRVTLDITKPQRRCIKVNLDDPMGSCWTPIRYEKLPDLCSYCGIIGHSSKECSVFLFADGPSSLKQQYGPWMQFSRRTSTMYRSPSNNPLSKNKMVSNSSV